MKDKARMISLMICTLLLAADTSQAVETTSVKAVSKGNNHIDLSKPEYAIDLFVKAFRVGDDAMLSEVLVPQAVIPEFNPLQKIECPSPELIGFDITKSHVVTGTDRFVAASQPGDVEARVLLRIDEKKINKECLKSLWEKGVYVLRNTANGWQIIAIIPFWPEEVERLSK